MGCAQTRSLFWVNYLVEKVLMSYNLYMCLYNVIGLYSFSSVYRCLSQLDGSHTPRRLRTHSTARDRRRRDTHRILSIDTSHSRTWSTTRRAANAGSGVSVIWGDAIGNTVVPDTSWRALTILEPPIRLPKQVICKADSRQPWYSYLQTVALRRLNGESTETISIWRREDRVHTTVIFAD